MQETARDAFAYLQANAVLSIGIALVAGWAAHKSVTSDERSGAVLFLIIGLVGLFLGQFVIFYFGLTEYLDKLSGFRLFFDFLAAYVGSFLVATLIHFAKPM